MIHFYDPLERGHTSFKGVEKVTNGKQSTWLNFSKTTTKKQLEEAFNSEQEKVLSLCQSLAIPFYSLSSAEPLINQIAGKHS